MTEKKRHNGNAIKHHGQGPAGNFASIDNDIIRNDDGFRLTSDAFRVYALPVSHDPGRWEESINGIAKRFHWGRPKVRKAIDNLVAARLPMVQNYVTAEGARAYETYHVHGSRRFTDAEIVKLASTVVLSKMNQPPGSKQTSPLYRTIQAPGLKRTTTLV